MEFSERHACMDTMTLQTLPKIPEIVHLSTTNALREHETLSNRTILVGKL
jgi:hypothetical protein